ncbi:GAF domain-containing protein [Dactylosporangium sp. McL0621]|uniref:GAF domain-containing protein n=1 Tax=Dactylosporangium sp. McL0621 TaxID=3415678 RepID=UPI003CFAD573
METPVPSNEAERISALHAMSVLDTAPETDFDDIVRITSEICGAPISLITLVDTDRQWFKATIGDVPFAATREAAFCAHAIMGRDLMVIPDATTDARFAANPYVRGDHGVRFYAGAPLMTSKGAALGTLCVVDHAPHRLDLARMRALRALAHQVTELLELRRLAVTAQLDVNPSRTIDLAYLTDDRIQDLRCIADARNICITLILENHAPLRADPPTLSRALDYATFTALKAAGADAQVGVRVRDSPAPAIELAHAGGSVTADWYAELTGERHSDDPVPRAVAAILRAHGATVACTSATVGSPGVLVELRFPAV